MDNLLVLGYDGSMGKIKVLRAKHAPLKSGGRRGEYLSWREQARKLAKERIAYYNQVYGFSVGRVSIKNAKTRWGSCSRKGNLNFSYKIALLSPELADYIIVHELCHLGEFNHSKRFWELVGRALPNYKQLKKQFYVRKI